MKIEIYKEPEENKEETLLLRLRCGSGCVYLDAVNKKGVLRGVIVWINEVGKVCINDARTLRNLRLSCR